jgi:hypothetical protein
MVGTTQCLEGLAALAGISLGERAECDWPEIEADLGLRLPPDYKALAEAFPSGWFRRLVRPRKPARFEWWCMRRASRRPRQTSGLCPGCGTAGHLCIIFGPFSGP